MHIPDFAVENKLPSTFSRRLKLLFKHSLQFKLFIEWSVPLYGEIFIDWSVPLQVKLFIYRSLQVQIKLFTT